MNLSHHNIKVKDGFALFWGSPFSNWYRASFIETSHVNGINIIKFSSTEQHMMYHKAMLFDDVAIARDILATKDPREQKELGHLVGRNGGNPYDDDQWSAVRYEVVKIGNYLKFTQNSDICDILLASKGLTIVEASPKDTIWGIGLGAGDPDATVPAKWRGTNLLGKVLMEVRDIIQAERDAK